MGLIWTRLVAKFGTVLPHPLDELRLELREGLLTFVYKTVTTTDEVATRRAPLRRGGSIQVPVYERERTERVEPAAFFKLSSNRNSTNIHFFPDHESAEIYVSNLRAFLGERRRLIEKCQTAHTRAATENPEIVAKIAELKDRLETWRKAFHGNELRIRAVQNDLDGLLSKLRENKEILRHGPQKPGNDFEVPLFFSAGEVVPLSTILNKLNIEKAKMIRTFGGLPSVPSNFNIQGPLYGRVNWIHV